MVERLRFVRVQSYEQPRSFSPVARPTADRPLGPGLPSDGVRPRPKRLGESAPASPAGAPGSRRPPPSAAHQARTNAVATVRHGRSQHRALACARRPLVAIARRGGATRRADTCRSPHRLIGQTHHDLRKVSRAVHRRNRTSNPWSARALSCWTSAPQIQRVGSSRGHSKHCSPGCARGGVLR